MSFKTPEFPREIESDWLKAASVHHIVAALKMKAVALKKVLV